MANEKRLIDANDVLEEINEAISNIAFTSPYQNDIGIMVSGMERVLNIVEEAPTVDAVEVVHGRWENGGACNHVPHRIKNPEKWVIYKCSICGYSNGRKQSKYCPNCGAKMDGGAD